MFAYRTTITVANTTLGVLYIQSEGRGCTPMRRLRACVTNSIIIGAHIENIQAGCPVCGLLLSFC
jgi:hypothetical protein